MRRCVLFFFLGLTSCLFTVDAAQGTAKPHNATTQPQPTSLPTPGARVTRAESKAFPSSAMMGPYSSLESLCALLKRPERYSEASKDEPELTFYCETDAAPKPNALTPPYLSIQVVSGGWRVWDCYQEQAFLAVQTKEGWFVTALYDLLNPGGTGGRAIAQEVSSLSLVTLSPSSTPIIWIQTKYLSAPCEQFSNLCYEDGYDEMLLCGVGAHGRLACTNPIQTSQKSGTSIFFASDPVIGEPKINVDWSLQATFPGDGTVSLISKKTLAKEQAAMVGKFKVSF